MVWSLLDLQKSLDFGAADVILLAFFMLAS